LIGGALVRLLERDGVDVVRTSNSRAGSGVLAVDVRDAAAVERCIAAARADVIFLAVNVRGGVDRCEEDPDQAYAVNVEGTRYVAEGAAKHRARIVFYSSDYLFDGKAGPYTEGDPPNPINVYGRNKLEAEHI